MQTLQVIDDAAEVGAGTHARDARAGARVQQLFSTGRITRRQPIGAAVDGVGQRVRRTRVDRQPLLALTATLAPEVDQRVTAIPAVGGATQPRKHCGARAVTRGGCPHSLHFTQPQAFDRRAALILIIPDRQHDIESALLGLSQ